MSHQLASSNERIIDTQQLQRPREQIENAGYDLNESTTSFDSRRFNDDDDESEMSTTFDSTRDISIDDALFNENKVDELVESFWTKFDKKIEGAVLLQQETQKNQEQSIQNEIQEKEKKKKLAIEKHTEFFNFSYSFIFIIEFLLRIWILFKTKVSHKIKGFRDFLFSIPWREKLAFYVFHRHAHFVVVLLSVIDVMLVLLIILDDFEYIDGIGNELLFTIFQRVCLAIMFCFLLEVSLKLMSVGKNIMQDKMEVFDTALVVFYFGAELIGSKAFRYIDDNYPRYIHIVVVLRLWRVALIINEMCMLEQSTLETTKNQSKADLRQIPR